MAYSKHPKIVFNNTNYYRDPRTGYYYNTKYPENKKTLLHRDIWEYHNGKIKKGYVIHHIDHDKENNALDNLACMTRKAHQSYHALEGGWPGSKANLTQFASVNHLAKAWHSSPEGIEWHKKNGVKAWESRKYYTLECATCGNKYDTPFPTRSKFCHLNCRQRAMKRRRRGVPISDVEYSKQRI